MGSFRAGDRRTRAAGRRGSARAGPVADQPRFRRSRRVAAQHRRGGHDRRHSAVAVDDPHPRDAPREVHPLPLRDLAIQLAGDPGVAVAQIGGNLLVFAAFGALAPLRFRALARLPVIIGLAAAGSLTVETLQYALALGRVS